MKTRKNKILIFVFSIIIFFAFLIYYKRSFYCNDGVCITVWKMGGDKSYIVKGRYFGIIPPKRDYVKVYSSKGFYVCWNDKNSTAFNMGSLILEKNGFDGFNFYSHDEFFKKFRGQIYLNGENVYDSLHIEKKKKYNIEYIKPYSWF